MAAFSIHSPGLVVGLFEALCVALVASFLGFCCVPRLHAPARRLLRPLAVFHVEAGLAWVGWAQSYQAPWLTALFEASSHAVSVGFYGSFLPTLIWLGMPQLGWHLVALMTLTLYVGNAIKDLVSSPRPAGLAYGSARVRLLGGGGALGGGEEAGRNAREYGLPSSHTMNSLALNMYVVHWAHEQGMVDAPAAAVLYACVALWVVWIASSRLYLGLHTPIDILAGAVAGLAVLVCFMAVEGPLEAWVVRGRWVSAQLALVALVLLRLHPRPAAATPSYEFTVSFMGVLWGALTGVSRNPWFHEPPLQLAEVWGHGPAWCLRRLVLGFSVVLGMKALSKAVCRTVVPPLYRFFPLRLRRLWQPPVHGTPLKDDGVGVRTRSGASAERTGRDGQSAASLARASLPLNAAGQPWDVEITVRFFAYAGIGFAASEVAPRLFRHLGW